MDKDHKPVLGNYRNNWYNRDYLDLLATRTGLGKYSSILDVGCGKFHWSSLLAGYLKPGYKIAGLDINNLSDDEMSAIALHNSINGSCFDFVSGDSNNMPFEDSSFEVVTCQTLLIHIENPLKTLTEMYRVLKKGGAIIVSEPNNLAQVIFRNSLNLDEPVNERLETIRAKMLSEKHKIEEKNGDNSVGELVPLMLETAGFTDINCYLNDKVTMLKPPYETSAEKEKIEMLSKLIENYPYTFSEREKNEINGVLEEIRNQRFSAYSPTMLFITIGTK